MSHFRRSRVTGGTFFFTVVTYRRQRFLCDYDVRLALRESILRAREHHPFEIDAWVLLPDHMHCIWTLPDGDADFSTRWNVIKRGVTRRVGARLQRADLMNESKAAHRESTLWQRRFWEHQIRDDADYQAHKDYIHFNPVKHGLIRQVCDWPHSSFHRYVASGVYAVDWATPPNSPSIDGDVE
jgi:putative transposase